jgi:hypothetical protein
MQDVDGIVVIRTKPEAGRVVGGMFLALIGGALGWQTTRAILINRASTHAAWSAYVPAVLMFGGIALAFLIPGAMMVAYRRSVRFDLAKREVTESQRYLGYRRTRTYPFSLFHAIVLAPRSVGRPRRGRSAGSGHRVRTYRIYVVELARAAGNPLRIVADRLEEPAREIAARLASATGIPLHDEVAGERERERRGADLNDGDA